FLAEHGSSDPEAELTATVEAFLSAPAGDPDEHAQCRFPARYAWLRTQLAWPDNAVEVACGRYRTWLGAERITSISLVLGSGYLDNPSSSFGHVLLRFNSARDEGPGDNLFDTTLNYGANYPHSENGLLYVVRGLTGQYRSTFTYLDYFQYDTRYSEEQLRDAWEYRLALSQAEVDFVVAHAWELMGAENRYFFLRQNCAYRMAELVSLVIDDALIPSSKIWAMPPDVFDRIADVDHNGEPLLREVVYHPSRQSRFRDRYFALSAEERAEVRLYVNDPGAGAQSLSTRDVASRSRVLDVLIDYYTYLEADPATMTGDVRRARNQLLVERMRLPAAQRAVLSTERLRAPHEGQNSSMVQISAVTNDARGEAFDIRFRATYYDYLSVSPATLPFSELSMGDVTLRVEDGDVELHKFELLRVSTLNISGTGLPNDGHKNAWRVRVGAEQADLACDDSCLVAFAEGGYGRGWRTGSDSAVYAFANARLSDADETDANAQAGASVGAIFGEPSSWRVHVEAGAWQPLNGEDDDVRPYLHAETRLGGTRGWDIRIATNAHRIRGESVAETRVALGVYW
ncbi:MAG TPA: DUF4105 domain-containing protein, partial [Vitreimonas sp.]|nr:DUF4105 domain-containing protein [Vitreimonas sp.]